MPTENKTHRDEVRPFVLFMLTGGFIMATVMVSLQRYSLGVAIGIAGFSGAILLDGAARFLDRMGS